jgi:hypothetical protein
MIQNTQKRDAQAIQLKLAESYPCPPGRSQRAAGGIDSTVVNDVPDI